MWDNLTVDEDQGLKIHCENSVKKCEIIKKWPNSNSNNNNSKRQK